MGISALAKVTILLLQVCATPPPVYFLLFLFSGGKNLDICPRVQLCSAYDEQNPGYDM